MNIKKITAVSLVASVDNENLRVVPFIDELSKETDSAPLYAMAKACTITPKVHEGYALDPKTGLYMVYVSGELRGCAKDQVEAAQIYEEVRK